MTTSDHSPGTHLALSRARVDRGIEDEAEVIDLVHLPRGTRPTPIAYLEYEEVGRCREMNCDYYQACLDFAARVRWRSFHCRQCPKHTERAHREACSVPGTEVGNGGVVIRLR